MWHIIKAVLRIFPFVIWDYFAWMIKYSGKNKDKYPLEVRYKRARKLCLRANKYLKVDAHIEGKENMPNEKACYVANHLGAADPLLFFEAFDKPMAFLGKVELEKMPFVARVFTSINSLFLKRDDLKQQLKVMMRVQNSLEIQETNWVIFPEGTRIKDQMNKIAAFHPGTFRNVMKAKAPIVPVVTYGSFRFLSKKHNLKKYPAHLKFLKPIYYKDYKDMTTEEVAELVHSMIQRELSFNIRKKDHEEMVQLKTKKYRFNRIY